MGFFFLFQVAKVHPKDSRYLLRDDFYKCVQKDWPGYSDSERQLISRMLARWVDGRVGRTRWTPSANVALGLDQK